MNKLYTAQEVADRLKIKKTTVYKLIKRGELESSKIGKQLRVSEEQLTQYLNRKRDYLLHSSGIILGGQTSAALELLLGKMSAHPDGLPVLQSHMNDYNGLYSLYFEKAHIAATSLDIDDIRHLVPGIPLILLSLCTGRKS